MIGEENGRSLYKYYVEGKEYDFGIVAINDDNWEIKTLAPSDEFKIYAMHLVFYDKRKESGVIAWV